MIIGIDGHVIDGRPQGSRTWLLHVIPLLADQLPECTFILYTLAPVQNEINELPENVQNKLMPRLPSAVRIMAYWSIMRHIDSLDLLVSQYITPLWPAKRQVAVVHDILFESHPHFFPARYRWRNKLLVRISAKRASLVVTVSEYSRRELLSRYNISPSRLVKTPNGVEVDDSSDASTSPQDISPELEAGNYILFVGRLEPRKNLALALEAFNLALAKDRYLVIVGRNDFEDPGTLQRLRSQSNAIHLTDVSDSDLGTLYANASALVYPSLGEGWGVPVTEAIARGVPALVADNTALREAGDELAYYFDPRDPAAAVELAAKIDCAFKYNSSLRPSRTSVDSYRREHAWENSIQALAELIQARTETTET